MGDDRGGPSSSLFTRRWLGMLQHGPSTSAASASGPHGGGCEMLFCPLMMVPSSSCAPSVMRSSVQMHGSTSDAGGMPLTRENMKMAESIDPKKVRAPAKKKFPTEPLTKENRALLLLRMTRNWKWTRKARIVCLYGSDIPSHSACSPSVMASHSALAPIWSVGWRRCARSSRTASASSLPASASRRHRERMSPTAGPPRKRTISAVLPPSSDTGST
mmetsp:Transcript_32403/g.103112  ORF Transcript_32403/g.103112 Transcript_32403/m.103112 type:complete len:217 (-) Transcript_32403:502-1152(-)